MALYFFSAFIDFILDSILKYALRIAILTVQGFEMCRATTLPLTLEMRLNVKIRDTYGISYYNFADILPTLGRVSAN